MSVAPKNREDTGIASPFNELWKKVSAVVFDLPEAEFLFSARLARDNGWSAHYASRVLTEYRKFACLAVLCEHEVTPSDQVDQAWHLHLLYTRHYWGEWSNALGVKIHHGPTKGGTKEAQRYTDNYNNTLASYFKYFGDHPPEDIWPSQEERFRDPGRFVRIDVSKHVILKKPWHNF